mgnify:CR=1 FL=1
MVWSETALIISLMVISSALIAAAVILAVRQRKNKKWKPSKEERRLLRGLDEYTAHADEAATLTQEELDLELRDKLRGSVRHYDDPTEPVVEDDWGR